MKKKYKTIVLGSGVGGLGAGCWLKNLKEDFIIIERLKEIPMNLHNGVHYLHSVPELPFDANLKEITLTDGVLTDDGRIRHTPELQDALQYSEKVRSIQHPSSIYEVGKKHSVFVPKSNGMNDYIKEMADYIGKESFFFGMSVVKIDLSEKVLTVDINGTLETFKFDNVISTLPMKVFLQMCGYQLFPTLKFDTTPIETLNFKVDKIVPNWLINIYVPSPNVKPYRMSILNGNASIESVSKIETVEYGLIQKLFSMFHFDMKDPQSYTWQQGKIVSLDTDTREAIISDYIPQGVFFIGRFGLWNNKLLMDSTINQSKEVCRYISYPKVGKEQTELLVKSLLK